VRRKIIETLDDTTGIEAAMVVFTALKPLSVDGPQTPTEGMFRRYYGAGCKKQSIAEIAQFYGKTEGHTIQVIWNAREKLRKKLRELNRTTERAAESATA
jgi:hypothetical protein